MILKSLSFLKTDNFFSLLPAKLRSYGIPLMPNTKLYFLFHKSMVCASPFYPSEACGYSYSSCHNADFLCKVENFETRPIVLDSLPG